MTHDQQPDLPSAVADELPVGVWVARAPTGEFLYANRRFQEIMGMAARDDVAAGEYAAPYGIHDLDGNPYPEERMPFVQALRAGTTVTVDDIVIHRTDGVRVYIRAFAKPVRDGTGAITHVIIAFIDITREVTAERGRAESERRLHLAQRMEAIGNLAGGVAHDFNNLLAALKLLAASVRHGEEDPDRLSALAGIDELTDRAASLTRSLLGFAGRGTHLSAPVGLNPMVTGLAEIFRRTLVGVADVHTRLEAPGDAVVIGDRAQLEQVVMNLVVNARDAVAASGAHGTITVVTRAVELAEGDAAEVGPGRWMMLEVIDDGPGIPAALRERVFEPYFTTRTQGPIRGTGLGLATVFGVVERHGGRVFVDDAPGGAGALLRVYLPAADAARVQAEPAARRRGVVRGTGTVLIVDDEPLVRTGMARALRIAGYQVVEAASGREAIDRFRDAAGAFDAVVLDLVMPGMSGRATYQALRAIRPEVAVLMVSGFDADGDVQAVLDLGVRAFLAKPCSLQDLSAAVAGILRGA
ncbi:MAG TPA: response regulator [Kofleriaceae bacterium]|nr:response regulator [Kofleriaceae bacterium]